MHFGLVAGGGPAVQEQEVFLVPRPGLGGVGEDGQPGVGHEVEPVVGEAELADDGVAEVLDPGDVVTRPRTRRVLSASVGRAAA
jgi:hypothetical protein